MNRIESSTLQDVAFFVALFATALALGGALAHALELPNKIGMSREHYFIVQRAYDGWNQLAYLLAVELAGMLAVIWLYRAEPRVLWPAIAALTSLVAAQAVFWIWTFPANQATSNWTSQPENWETLRRNWEYSHLAGAVFQVLAMVALVIAVLRRDHGAIVCDDPPRGPVTQAPPSPVPLMGWSGRAPASPAIEAGQGHQRQGAPPWLRSPLLRLP